MFRLDMQRKAEAPRIKERRRQHILFKSEGARRTARQFIKGDILLSYSIINERGFDFMYIYMTAGTIDFLRTIKNKYPNEKMMTIENEDGALLLHETGGDTVFKEPRKYEILDSVGTIGDKGFVVMNNIPVTDEGRPIFEYRFKNRAKQIENETGFIAIRVLRPLSSSTYIIMTVWDDENSFKNWKNSSSFKQAHGSKEKVPVADPQPKIFASASYVTKYTVSE